MGLNSDMSDNDDWKVYYKQFEPADLADAKELVRYCLDYNIVIDVEDYNDDFKADLMIVKCMELAKLKSRQ